jgi:hypothetical protein
MSDSDPRLRRERPTDQQLEREAEITPDDINDAIRQFNRHAPAEAKGLLSANPDA